MSIRNLKRGIARKIGAILVALGVSVPMNIYAAALNTNLVVNPSFENVDTSVGGSFGSVLILDWEGGGFAYNYGQGYDNGGSLTGGGDYYFNGGPTDSGEPISQVIDVSTGESSDLIASGAATYELSGYFSSYLTQGDFGNLSAIFLDQSGSELETATVSDADTSTWTLESISGLIPVGTTSVRIESLGTAVAGSPDGYLDLVDFRIVPEPTSTLLCGLGLAGAGLMSRRRRRQD